MVRTLLCAGMVSATAAVGLAEASEIPVAQDYMTSGFFQSNFVRGQEPGSTRASNRATSETIFGVTGETAYFSFDFDPSLFSGSVPKATFVVESVSTGFFTDPSPGNPTDVSIHSLTADPLASIDINAPSGPGSWIDFRDSQITTSSIVTTTSVDGLGVFEWDITSLVNDWIANGDSNFAYTIGTSALLDEEGEAAVAFVNSSWDDLSDEVTARIVVIPAPGASAVLAAAGLVCTRRRRS